MATQWARQEAHKNDLALAFEGVWHWIQTNRQIAMTGAILAVALLAGGGFFIFQRMVMQKAAWHELSDAQLAGAQGHMDAAISKLDDLIAHYGQTSAWGFGVLLKGDILYRDGKFKEAAQTYRKVLDNQSPKPLLPFAMSDVGLSQEAAHDYDGAIETAHRFLDLYKDHFLAPQMNASLARCLTSLGRKQEAKAAFQQMATLYPDDVFWSQWAQSKGKSAS